MKKLQLSSLVIISMLLLLNSCQKQDQEIVPTKESGAGVSNKTAKQSLLPCPQQVFALVLGGNVGTPIPAGYLSYICKVDLCSNPVGFNFVSQLKINNVAVTDVTGICDNPGIVDFGYAVTGINSNFPKKLLRFQISTGISSIVNPTTDALQDIEYYPPTNLYVAIKEGTSQLMKVAVPSGICTAFSPVGPTSQYNGLTVVGNKLQAISGNTALICSPTSGDIFEYPVTGGNYTGKYSYKNLAANSLWTMKELGFYFDDCCQKRWVVGSSNGFLSNNLNITPCILPNPNFLINTKPIYDFMSKQ
jgi:hypothetical protein